MRGRIATVEPYDAYVKYLAMKSHFTDKKYDYIKYNGKVKAWRTTFETRRDKYFFYKLSKQKNPEEQKDQKNHLNQSLMGMTQDQEVSVGQV